MKEFLSVDTAGLTGVVLSFYQTPKQIYTEGSLYPELVKDLNEPDKVLHIQRVEDVQILFPADRPNTIGVVSMPAQVILQMAARINELQAKEEFLNMDE